MERKVEAMVTQQFLFLMSNVVSKRWSSRTTEDKIRAIQVLLYRVIFFFMHTPYMEVHSVVSFFRLILVKECIGAAFSRSHDNNAFTAAQGHGTCPSIYTGGNGNRVWASAMSHFLFFLPCAVSPFWEACGNGVVFCGHKSFVIIDTAVDAYGTQ